MYLGLITDQNLKWHGHYLTKKIRKLRTILHKSLLTIVYQVLVESVIRDGIFVWKNLYRNAYINSLFIKIYFKDLTQTQNNLLKNFFLHKTVTTSSSYLLIPFTFIFQT